MKVFEFRWLVQPYPDDSPVLQYLLDSGKWITVPTVHKKVRS